MCGQRNVVVKVIKIGVVVLQIKPVIERRRCYVKTKAETYMTYIFSSNRLCQHYVIIVSSINSQRRFSGEH